MKKCAVLVPAYQCEDTIGETLESLQRQGAALGRVDAVFVSDDCSKDRTIEVAQNTWRANTPLKILRAEKNRGEYVNVNEAVQQFADQAEWFLIMHADNYAKEGWLKTLLDRIEIAPDSVGTICTSWDDLNFDSKIIPGDDRPAQGVITTTGSKESVRDTLLRGTWWHISSCAIRVKTYLEIGGLPKGMRQKGDWDFLLRLLSSGWNVEYIPRTLMVYHHNPVGSSSQTARQHLDIRENIQVIGWHHKALSSGDLVRLHLKQLWFLMRRAVRSLTQLNFNRLFAVPPTGILVLRSLVRCLMER